ncbi:MAG: hypothetical protein KDN19_15145, partial [Verrucomicrobiae bacterium]|nr:hypothetical protein [Verrucomicrobiae bacterium]
SDYSWVEPGEEEGTNVPVKRRNLDLYRQYSQIAADNGIRFFVMIGAGLYLIFGGKFIHRIVTRRP